MKKMGIVSWLFLMIFNLNQINAMEKYMEEDSENPFQITVQGTVRTGNSRYLEGPTPADPTVKKALNELLLQDFKWGNKSKYVQRAPAYAVMLTSTLIIAFPLWAFGKDIVQMLPKWLSWAKNDILMALCAILGNDPIVAAIFRRLVNQYTPYSKKEKAILRDYIVIPFDILTI